MKHAVWDNLAKNYEENVLSLTKIPQRRKQILNELKKGKILNMGCGPTDYLNKALVNTGNSVVATDISQKMLNSAKNLFEHENINYILCDSKNLLFKDNHFDSIISVNSIIPEKRKDVFLMFEEIHRVLKKGGRCVAFSPSYDSAEKAAKDFGMNIKLDDKEYRMFDTGHWQCFHTDKTLEDALLKSGFEKHKIKKVFLKTNEEFAQIKKLYGVDTTKHPIHEYFLVAEK